MGLLILEVNQATLPVVTILFTVILAFLIWWSLAPFWSVSYPNLRGPKPWPLVGNFFHLHGGKDGFPQNTAQLIQEYGEVIFFHEGRNPMMMVADPKMLKQILVKEFYKFQDRVHALGSPKRTLKIFREQVIFLEGKRWKEVRSVLTPALSAAKIKDMSPLVNFTTSKLLDVFETHRTNGEPFDIWMTFGNYTLDVIASAAFGIDTESQNELNNQFSINAHKVFQSFSFRSVRYFMSTVFPFLLPLAAAAVRKQRGPTMKFFEETIDQVIRSRQQSHGEERKDFVSLLIEAAAANENSEGKKNKTSYETFSKAKLTSSEMRSQVMVFLLAAFDTTANALSYCAYLLARHPDVQERLIQEVEDMLEGETNLDYYAVQKMPYMEMVISETLRMYPPGQRFNRQCLESCTINGIHFPKGMHVDVPVYGIHHNPKYWPDPEKFDPERFTAEAKAGRDPYTYLPFSHGPRNCIGIRFAQLEMKIALSRILQKFKFKTCSQTEVPLKVDAGITLSPRNGIYLVIVDRDEAIAQ
ncbi:thromboxane-A synthase-like isoform X2 [Glandiceps talaboti]